MEESCTAAAASGRLDILEWLRSGTDPCPWSTKTINQAVRKGHFELFKWAVQNHCPIDETARLFAEDGGQEHVVQWIDKNLPHLKPESDDETDESEDDDD